MSSKVLIVGSINIDCTVLVEQIVKPGQTIRGSEPQFLPGGKGGNQAVSVSANGGQAFMIGGVGTDDHGQAMLDSLNSYGVDTSGVSRHSGATGTAYIFVEQSGENSIVVTAGANGKVSVAEVDASIRKLAGSNPVILCQMELPDEVVEHSAKLAAELKGRFVLNLAPAEKISQQLLESCDPIILNESEASFLTGAEISSVEQAVAAAAEISKSAKSCVITLGEQGAVFVSGSTTGQVPGEKVKVVDTTGAGDAFVGALVTALADGLELGDAVADGVKAGTKAVGHFGAQPPKS